MFSTLQGVSPQDVSIRGEDDGFILLASSVSSQKARLPSGNRPSHADGWWMHPSVQCTEPPWSLPHTETCQPVISGPFKDLEGGPMACVMGESKRTTATSIHPRKQTTHGEVVEARWKVVLGCVVVTVILLDRSGNIG